VITASGSPDTCETSNGREVNEMVEPLLTVGGILAAGATGLLVEASAVARVVIIVLIIVIPT